MMKLGKNKSLTNNRLETKELLRMKMINEIEKNFKDIQASIINKFEKFELSKNLNKYMMHGTA